MKLTSLATFISCACALSGCATVKFLDDKGNNEGYIHYPAKPYLAIGTTKEGSVTATVFSLPDLANPKRVKYCPGWGSFEFGFESSNGILTEFNATGDSKGPETLTAIAGLATSGASVITAKAAEITAEALMGDDAAGANKAAGERKNVVPAAVEAQAALSKQVLLPLAGAMQQPLKSRKEALTEINDGLVPLGVVTYTVASGAPATDLGDLVEQMNSIRGKARSLAAELRRERGLLEKIADMANASAADRGVAAQVVLGIDVVIAKLEPLTKSDSAVQIFEVSRGNSGLRFTRIELHD